MKVLVVGSGGREHALAWRLALSPSVDSVLVTPGNVGIATHAQCHAVAVDDLDGVVELARQQAADLVVVGPEMPLTLGMADVIRDAGIACFGPGADGAQLEGSKAYAKDLMERAGIPTAGYHLFTQAEEALAHVAKGSGPIVVKASGLAAGKGAIVCANRKEARLAVEAVMVERQFGDAGDMIVIEDYLVGEEASVLALTDGKTLAPLVSSQDHKPIGEGDTGLNTGGMGAYAPAPVASPAVMEKVRTRVLEPLLRTLSGDGIEYRGVIYAGLMIDEAGDPWVVEFNCRFGDPEAQVVLPLVEGDFGQMLMDCARGDIDPGTVRTADGAAVCVVLASGGYPGEYDKGKPISGLEAADSLDDVVVFHAGTSYDAGRIVTAGGRVLGVTAFAGGIRPAVDRAYEAVDMIGFEGAYCRRDIAHRALARDI
jgi:phosphoribosylamine--glycine ligase